MKKKAGSIRVIRWSCETTIHHPRSQPKCMLTPMRLHTQQHRVRRQARNSDAYAFFNLLTGPELFDKVESLLPQHRERLFPPTETLSMFLAQALSADRSCQKAVDEAAVKRLAAGWRRAARIREPIAERDTPAAGHGEHTGALHRARDHGARTPGVALARPSGAAGGRHDGDDAGHAGQSGGVSAIAQPEAGPGFSAVPDGGH